MMMMMLNYYFYFVVVLEQTLQKQKIDGRNYFVVVAAAEDILDNEMYFIDAIGLKEHLSMTRSNGLVSMIKQMKFYALAFQAK